MTREFYHIGANQVLNTTTQHRAMLREIATAFGVSVLRRFELANYVGLGHCCKLLSSTRFQWIVVRVQLVEVDRGE